MDGPAAKVAQRDQLATANNDFDNDQNMQASSSDSNFVDSVQDTEATRSAHPVSRLTREALRQVDTTVHRRDVSDLSSAISPIMSRSPSVSSGRYSTVSTLTGYFPINLLGVVPAPAYVAQSGAMQVVRDDKGLLGKGWNDEEIETLDNSQEKLEIQFGESALATINSFLDQLLFSFLSTARSTSLLALRPAVTEVLKSRLAKEAIASAESELAELRAGGDDHEDADNRPATSPSGDGKWDLELVWKRTRLRVMVYTRLGEMEDADEEHFVSQEELFSSGEHSYSRSAGLVSWAAAFFLTSVLEYVAEQSIQIAGQAALTRTRRRHRNLGHAPDSSPTGTNAIVVEVHDVEKIALNSTMGRLWRTWRKAVRNRSGVHSPTGTHSRSISTNSNQQSSFGTANEGPSRNHSNNPSTTIPGESLGAEFQYPEHILAANIPLPLEDAQRDIDEIEVPGLARDPDAADIEESNAAQIRRYSLKPGFAPVCVLGKAEDAFVPSALQRPSMPQQRSLSMPSQSKPPVWQQRVSALPGTFPQDAETLEAQAPQEEADKATVEDAQAANVSEARSIESTVVAEDGAKDELTARVSTPEQVAEEFTSAPASPTMDHEKSDEPDSAQPSGLGLLASGVGIAAAGIAAIGSSAAALVYGSKDSVHETVLIPDEDGKARNETPVDSVQEAGDLQPVHSDANATLSPSFDGVNEHAIEERKSLIDIKALIASDSAPRSARQSSRASIESTEAYTLGNKNTAIPTHRDIYTVKIDSDDSRGQNGRPARLVIGTSPSNSPGRKARDSAGSRDADVLSLDNRHTPSSPSPNEQTRFLLPQNGPNSDTNTAMMADGIRRGSSPDIAGTAAAAAAAAAAAQSQSMTSQPAKRPSEDGPLRQRIAPIRKSKASLSSMTDVPIGSLTSASIRGPEDFDTFLQGAETVKYTLTPETVRDEPNPSSPTSPGRMMASPTDTRSGRNSMIKPAVSPTQSSSSFRERSRSFLARSISRPDPQNIRSSRSGFFVREARVQTESTRDFADFIRSTGPQRETQVYPVMANPSAHSLHSLRTAHINGASATASAAASRSTSPGRKGNQAPPPLPPLPTGRKGTQMQARSAKASTQANSELIDFIRSGPDETGKHRIPRTVAPFRTTMDSDQFRELADRSSEDHYTDRQLGWNNSSVPSVQSTISTLGQSTRNSTNSRSALLGSYSAAPAVQAPRGNDGKRRVRNKDPYSLDFMDEDSDEESEDLLTALPNNRDEDAGARLGSLPDATGNGLGSSNPTIPRTASMTSNGSRVRPGSVHSARSAVGSSMPSNSSSRPPRNGMVARDAVTSVSSPIGYDPSLRPVQRTATADLADFLRNSGPVADPDSAPAPTVIKAGKLTPKEAEKRRKQEEKIREKEIKKASGVGKGFLSGLSVRKKQYIDMS